MNKRGSILLLVLVFGSVFFIILSALAGAVLSESKYQEMLLTKSTSFTIAEAGLEHYAWFLNRYPTDLQHGTGRPGPYVIPYTDVTGNKLGTFELSVSGTSACGTLQSIDITSKGVSTKNSTIYTTLVGRYASRSVASYSIASSSAISSPDFPSLKTSAQGMGAYFPRLTTPEQPFLGYHLIFNNNGTVSVYKVNTVTVLKSVKPADGSSFNVTDYSLIATEEPVQTLPISSQCGLIFIEDNAWIEGIVSGSVTVVAANLSGSGTGADIIIRNNIVKDAARALSGITVIAQHNILIAPDSPDTIAIQGVFIASQGTFGRNNFMTPSGGCNGKYEARGTITMTGTVVSSRTPIVRWKNGCAVGKDAGYQTWNLASDASLAAAPPPFTPYISGIRQFISWQQTH